MELLKRNPDYALHCVDPDTGYGLLYSQKRGDCAFLNPLATALWRLPTDSLDSSLAAHLFSESMKVSGSEEYLIGVVSDLRKKGLLLPADAGAMQEPSPQRPVKQNHPLGQVYLYATKECNARCFHCYQPTQRVESSARERQAGQITPEAFLQLVEQGLPLGLRSIKITGGEPLLRTDLGTIIRGARKLGVHVSIETNGFLIDETLADLLAENDVDVSISLDGGSAAVHDALRGLPGSFDRVTRALRLLSGRGRKPKVIMAVSHRNLGEVDGVLGVASGNGCYLVKLNPVNTLGLAQRLVRQKVLLTVKEIVALYEKRKEFESRFGIFIYVEGPPAFASLYDMVSGHAAICPFTQILGVLSDGSISFCGIGNSCPELIFGRIDERGFNLARFWHEAEALVEVRKVLTRKLQGVCARCVLEPFCKGSCRALAYGDFKSFSAPHPWCQSAYDEGTFPSQYLTQQMEGS